MLQRCCTAVIIIVIINSRGGVGSVWHPKSSSRLNCFCMGMRASVVLSSLCCCRSTLTGVPVERQKLLCKGKTLKGDADLRAVAASGCPKIMLMGTAEEAAKVLPPPEKTVFVEDLTPAQQAALLREKKVEPLPNVRA